MGLRLGITGMDSATEAELKAAFDGASAVLAGRWRLAPEPEAEHVVVDMDSMYGPMSWLRLHAAGKQVIGLTTSPRTQADHLLPRPFDASSLGALLAAIADAAGTEAFEAPTPPAQAPSVETVQDAPIDTPSTAAPAPAEAPPSAATPAPAPAHVLPEEAPVPPRRDLAPAPEPAATLAPAASIEPSTAPAPEPGLEPPAPAPASAPPANEPVAPRETTFADWLAPGALSGRWRYRHGGATVLFDADARTYHGPATLKPLAAAFEGAADRASLEQVDAAAWPDAIAGAGDPQPLARLQWLGHLLAGHGALLPDHDPDGQYRLVKWPQTEREYPKHFRIATAMMKGPATLDDVAAASGVPKGDVADFVNANLATGYAEFVPPAPPEPLEPAKPSGLFGRMRGR